MASYKLEIGRTAEKQLRQLEKAAQKRVLQKVLALAHDPLPPGSRKLAGEDDAYRIRIGTYRVIYRIDNRVITVFVLKIGHRRDVYR